MGPLVVLSMVSLVDQIDMAILRGVLPILEDEWHLSDFKLGLLGFSFIFINTIATVPAGWMADHWRRNKLMGWTLVSWSGLIILSATAVNYWNLVVARAVMGIGQSIDDPASTSMLGDYYPPRMRSRVFSAQQIAFFVGGGAGLALGGWVGAELGWRWAFAIVGIPGSLIAIFCFRLREPVRGEADLLEHGVDPAAIAATAEAQAAALPDPGDVPLRVFLKQMRTELIEELKVIFGIRTMRYILVGVSALLFTVSGIGYWLAVYHDRFSGMTEKEATAFTALVLGVGGGIGTVFGGWLSDRIVRNGPSGRIVLVVWSAVLCAALFMVSFAVANIPMRLALQFLGILSGAGAAPGLRRRDDGRDAGRVPRRGRVGLRAGLGPVRDRPRPALGRPARRHHRFAGERVRHRVPAGDRRASAAASGPQDDRRGRGRHRGQDAGEGRSPLVSPGAGCQASSWSTSASSMRRKARRPLVRVSTATSRSAAVSVRSPARPATDAFRAVGRSQPSV